MLTFSEFAKNKEIYKPKFEIYFKVDTCSLLLLG